MRPDGTDEPGPPAGRRRAARRVLAWAPGFTHPAKEPKPAAPQDADVIKGFEAIGDFDGIEGITGIEGFEQDKFGDLGLPVTPVSVTPPSSWRKAAWFTVAASTIVLIVLVFTAVHLAGPGLRIGRIDAFPGLPTGGLLTPQPGPTGTMADPPPEVTDEAEQHSESSQPNSGGGSATAAGPPGQGQPGGGPPPGDGGDGQNEETLSASTQEQPPAGVDQMLNATQTFFDVLPEDVPAAWAMTSPNYRGNGDEQRKRFDKYWRKLRDVQLREVATDAEELTATATVFVTGHNGRSATQRWKLTYVQDGEFAIDELDLLDDDGDFDEGEFDDDN